MGVDRHIPLHSEWQHGTRVIEMSVSQHDRLRSRARAEARLSRFKNLVRPAGQSGSSRELTALNRTSTGLLLRVLASVAIVPETVPLKKKRRLGYVWARTEEK